MGQHDRFVVVQPLDGADTLGAVRGQQLRLEQRARADTRDEVHHHTVLSSSRDVTRILPYATWYSPASWLQVNVSAVVACDARRC